MCPKGTPKRTSRYQFYKTNRKYKVIIRYQILNSKYDGKENETQSLDTKREVCGGTREALAIRLGSPRPMWAELAQKTYMGSPRYAQSNVVGPIWPAKTYSYCGEKKVPPSNANNKKQKTNSHGRPAWTLPARARKIQAVPPEGRSYFWLAP